MEKRKEGKEEGKLGIYLLGALYIPALDGDFTDNDEDLFNF